MHAPCGGLVLAGLFSSVGRVRLDGMCGEGVTFMSVWVVKERGEVLVQ